MADAFCRQCGRPLAPDAQFCAACGTPVTPGTAGSSGDNTGSSPPPPLSFTEPAQTPLAQRLGLEGAKNFLLKHQLLTGGHSYRVLDDQQRPRFTVQESFGQGLGASLLGGAVGSVFAHRTLGWTVLDAAGNEQAAITLVVSGYHAVSTLADVSGAPVLVVTVDRGFMGGLTATAAGPDGRPMFQARGNLINQSFSILDPGGQEVARIHKALISVADTYNLDLVANVDPVGPLVFAILIDREKERR